MALQILTPHVNCVGENYAPFLKNMNIRRWSKILKENMQPLNMPEMIEVGQVYCNVDMPVFTFSDTNHCPQNKEDGLLCSKPSGK